LNTTTGDLKDKNPKGFTPVDLRIRANNQCPGKIKLPTTLAVNTMVVNADMI